MAKPGIKHRKLWHSEKINHSTKIRFGNCFKNKHTYCICEGSCFWKTRLRKTHFSIRKLKLDYWHEDWYLSTRVNDYCAFLQIKQVSAFQSQTWTTSIAMANEQLFKSHKNITHSGMIRSSCSLIIWLTKWIFITSKVRISIY